MNVSILWTDNWFNCRIKPYLSKAILTKQKILHIYFTQNEENKTREIKKNNLEKWSRDCF